MVQFFLKQKYLGENMKDFSKNERKLFAPQKLIKFLRNSFSWFVCIFYKNNYMHSFLKLLNIKSLG